MTNIYLVLSGLGSDLQLRLRQREVVSLKTASNDHFSTLKRLQSSIADSYLESQSQHKLYFHKIKGGFISRKQERNIEQKKWRCQSIADSSYLQSFKAIEIKSKWLFFLQAFNNRRCSFIDIFFVWTFRESSRTFFPRTNGRWVFAEISNSMLKLRRK